jgi:hypothetical protein
MKHVTVNFYLEDEEYEQLDQLRKKYNEYILERFRMPYGFNDVGSLLSTCQPVVLKSVIKDFEELMQ